MSRTIKSVIAAFALVVCLGVSASAAEYCSGANFLTDVQTYFANVDAMPGLTPPPAESVKQDVERPVTLGELDLSTIRNVLRRTAPMPSGLPSNDDAAVVAAPAAPVSYVEAPAAPVVYAAPAPVVYAAPAPVVYAPMVSTSTGSDCLPCRKNRR